MGGPFVTATILAPATQYGRARPASPHATFPTTRVQVAGAQVRYQAIAQHMFALMFRNVSSDGFRFADPADPSRFSEPGCIIAAPSYPANQPGVDQDYVFNWTRDAAITAVEIAAARLPGGPAGGVDPLIDYVTFAAATVGSAEPTLAHACFTIEGQPRPWTEQGDGPALQTLALLAAHDQLDEPTRTIAGEVIGKNLGFLLGAYTEPTTNLWEEHSGYSFFARAVQLKCLRAIAANKIGIAVPPGTKQAITWLEGALAGHWDGTRYLTLIAEPPGGGPPTSPVGPGYDPNIDIVMASIYGAIPVTDTRLLATAALLRGQWADSDSPSAYPINISDWAGLGIGPMMGRYPGDTYDGDLSDNVMGGHPWALCTANFAELYYRLGSEIARKRKVPYDENSSAFFGQVGVGADTKPQAAVAALDRAADEMLQAVIYHSDHLELSEQFDAATGFEKSVRNLTWSYAAFISAVRERSGRHVRG